MATFEDRLLGEKLHYYCSSDEEDVEEEDDGTVPEKEFVPEDSVDAEAAKILERAAQGPRKHNTGIKGVKEDARQYQRYILKQEQDKVDQLVSAAERFVVTDADDELDEDEEFLIAYREKRLRELAIANAPKFGKLNELTHTNYVETLDTVSKDVDVLVYIYEDFIASCRRYKEMLPRLCVQWPCVKVCCIKGRQAGVSQDFIQNGLPAFLHYKAGELVKSVLNITEYIDDEGDYDELTEYLQEQGVLPYQ